MEESAEVRERWGGKEREKERQRERERDARNVERGQGMEQGGREMVERGREKWSEDPALPR